MTHRWIVPSGYGHAYAWLWLPKTYKRNGSRVSHGSTIGVAELRRLRDQADAALREMEAKR